jgi:hypothetical protein
MTITEMRGGFAHPKAASAPALRRNSGMANCLPYTDHYDTKVSAYRDSSFLPEALTRSGV